MVLLDLDDDALDAVMLAMGTAALANFMCTCKVMAEKLNSQSLLARLSASRSITAGPSASPPSERTQFHCSADAVDSLEALAVVEALKGHAFGTNCIAFKLASVTMTTASKDLLRRYLDLLRRHPKLELRMDSHTGVGAPPQIHASHSIRRASAVADWLIHEGIDPARISACAWGYRVGMRRRWPARPEFARVELFVALSKPSDSDLPDVQAGEQASGAVAAAAAAAGEGGGVLLQPPASMAIATEAPAPAAEAVSDNDGENSVSPPPSTRTDSFDRSRCLPEWPSYFESITPVKAFFTFGADGDDEDYEAVDANEVGGGAYEQDGFAQAGMPQLFQMLHMLQGLGPGHVVQLPNGNQMDAAALLAMLQGNDADHSDSDDADDSNSDGGIYDDADSDHDDDDDDNDDDDDDDDDDADADADADDDGDGDAVNVA